jgi:hypothetical protein
MSSVFLIAATTGDLPKFQRLLKKGVATVTEADEDGRSALWIAIMNRRCPSAQWPVENGADMSISIRRETL